MNLTYIVKELLHEYCRILHVSSKFLKCLRLLHIPVTKLVCCLYTHTHLYIYRHTHVLPRIGFPCGSVVKNLLAIARDKDSFLGLGRYPGEGNGNPLQYSYQRNPTDRGAWQATIHGVPKESDMT